MDKAPIVFFAYNRPRHTGQTLESLAKCEGAAESELFVFCDGPKQSQDEEAIQQVRSIVKGRKWCGTVNVIERDENRGISKSIIAGVSEVVNRYGRIIVLEDDVVLSPQFVNYMNDALEVYADKPEVMHISGYMFPVKGELPETFFYRNTSCWGWGTWKRAWVNFEPDAHKLLAGFDDKDKKKKFNIEGSMNFYRMLQKQAKGKIDSWAIRWYASVFLAGGLCLHPGVPLAKNIGLDNSGVHCGATDAFNVRLAQKRVADFSMDIKESEEAVRLMVNFYRSLLKDLPLRAFNKLRKIIKL